MSDKRLLYMILIVCSSVALYLLWYALPYLIIFGGLGFAAYRLYFKDKFRNPFE